MLHSQSKAVNHVMGAVCMPRSHPTTNLVTTVLTALVGEAGVSGRS